MTNYINLYIASTPPTYETIQNKFPYLTSNIITESLKCFDKIPEYSHPSPPPPHIPPSNQPQPTHNHKIHAITWNASSINTVLPSLPNITTYTTTPPAFISIQETKITATKSTKYIQRLFPDYKMIFNNTHAFTRCIQQRLPYTSTRGGLLTLVHKTYTFPGNISKIPTPRHISPTSKYYK